MEKSSVNHEDSKQEKDVVPEFGACESGQAMSLEELMMQKAQVEAA